MREDGKLLAIGEYSGKISIFDIKNKFNLRTFKNHKKSVHALQFTPDFMLFSGSDDFNLRLFDISDDKIIRTIPNAHQDFIRSI